MSRFLEQNKMGHPIAMRVTAKLVRCQTNARIINWILQCFPGARWVAWHRYQLGGQTVTVPMEVHWKASIQMDTCWHWNREWRMRDAMYWSHMCTQYSYIRNNWELIGTGTHGVCIYSCQTDSCWFGRQANTFNTLTPNPHSHACIRALGYNDWHAHCNILCCVVGCNFNG